MIVALIAASMIGQCPGGSCRPAPQLVYLVPPATMEVRVTETTKTTLIESVVVVQTQNRKAGLFRRGVILKPLFANGSGQACLGSCN